MISGLVLVDSMDIFDLNDTLVQEIITGAYSFNLLDTLRVTGIPRFISSYPLQSGYLDSEVPLPDSLKEVSNVIFLTNNFLSASVYELHAIMDSLAQVEYIVNSTSSPILGSTPLVVLTATQNGDSNWNARQAILANYSTNSVHLFANSNHFIPLEAPFSIAQAIMTCISMSQ
eukprot:gene6730-7823_t